MRKLSGLAAAICMMGATAHASQEGALGLSTFAATSSGIGSSGPVSVRGEQNQEHRMVSLVVDAFGKTYVIPVEKLGELPMVQYNGMQLSFEAGYPELGGRTVYICLTFGFTSGVLERSVLSVTEAGGVNVWTGAK